MFTIIGFLLTTVLGLFITLLIVPKMHPLERLGLSYILGIGILTFMMFIGYVFGINFSLNATLIMLFVSISLLFLFVRKSFTPYFMDLYRALKNGNLSRLEKVILGVVLFLFVFSLVCTLYWPVGAWDSLVLYDWRAKLFYLTGNMDEGIRRGYFFGVPLLTSLAHTWAYFLGSKQPEFIYTLFFVSFILMFYGSLREFSYRLTSLVAILILATTPDVLIHSTFSYTNFPYTIYFVMSTIYLYIWTAKEKRGYLVLSAILLGLSTWTRSSEPFWIINLLGLIIFCLYKRKFLQPIFYSLIFFSIRQPWVIFENSKLDYSTTISGKITEGVSVILSNFNIDHMLLVAKFLYDNVFLSLTMLLTAFIVTFLLGIKNYLKDRDYWLFAIIIGYLLLIVVGTYIFSLTFRDWKIGGSAARMTMFIPPLIMFFITSSKKINNIYKSWDVERK